jgi:hypothetical protein
MKDIRRHKVLKDVIDKKLRGTEAAQLLNLTTVHISRLKKRLLNEGFEGLLRRVACAPPSNKIPEPVINKIIQLRKEFVLRL